ncbi:MAG: zinc-dependent metalloprotease, partial [Rikenellaceae bacterium]|nr:zinc-dependent metalloprotease [Rikenellaceae bacterium]
GRSVAMPDEVPAESMAYVAAHEIGHVLGLSHNMAASAGYPVDSLRSAAFTRQYGTTPSIMDYARYNYVAQPQDTGAYLSPPDLGVYDRYAIKWLYTPFDATATPQQEQEILRAWIDEKADDPWYRYGKEQVEGVYDPSARAEDLGDDPIRAGQYGIANLQLICRQLPRWFTAANDPEAEHRKLLMSEMTKQYQRYLEHAIGQIGGFYIHPSDGDPARTRQVPVPAQRQRESVRWVLEELRQCQWLDNPEVFHKTGLSLPSAITIVNSVFNTLQQAAVSVTLCSYVSSDPYTELDFYTDLYEGVWKSTIENRPLNSMEVLMQRNLLKSTKMPVAAIGGHKYLSSFEPDHWSQAEENMYPIPAVDAATERMKRNAVRTPEERLAAQVQQKVPVTLFEQSDACMLEILLRIRELVRERVTDGPEKDKAHYRGVSLTIDRMLSELM